MSPSYRDDPSAPIRWGVLATGGIARSFALDLALLDDAEVVAVGSRSLGRAQAFAAEVGAAHAYGSYTELVADPDVDAVYVASPHPAHHADTLLALRAGKPVLCEKPFAINAVQTREMIDAAREADVFLMEAMWSRFLPHLQWVREVVDSGALGDLRTVTADHGQWFEPDAGHRLFAPALGGGALLDLGIYPVSFAHWFLGAPSVVTAVSDPAFTGVDAQTSAVLQYPGGAHAVVTTTLQAQTVNRASVVGTLGSIDIDPTFYAPSSATLRIRGQEPEHRTFDHPGHGLRHEAAEVGRCLRAGERESAVLPLAETLAIMQVLDEVRRQIGLVYRGEHGEPE